MRQKYYTRNWKSLLGDVLVGVASLPFIILDALYCAIKRTRSMILLVCVLTLLTGCATTKEAKEVEESMAIVRILELLMKHL